LRPALVTQQKRKRKKKQKELFFVRKDSPRVPKLRLRKVVIAELQEQ
jgi:hypothetical protein